MSCGVLLRGQTLGELYPQLLAAIRDEGRPVAPRCLPTRELLAVTLVIERPTVPMLDDPVRVLNPAFAVAEACWVASGSDAGWIFDYNERLREFADAGALRGAYGPRLRGNPSGVDQLTRVRDLLTRDLASRQGVIQLFDPQRDWAGARDVPCTLGYRFFVRDGCLHQHTSMRSQDAWLGMPYDLFTNSVLHGIPAAELGVPVGHCVHTVDSMHLYERDLVRAAAVIAAADGLQPPPAGRSRRATRPTGRPPSPTQHRTNKTDLLHRTSSLRSWSHRSGTLDRRGRRSYAVRSRPVGSGHGRAAALRS